ncbi:class I SAM-dependent methyltransferase [Streptomyces sp. NPDC057654]|uniref:class I SAM-dependent methyltransferase n=1 Tax=Streptomyces sp. NPDC057654 TaxID=3346196 RepID=UPI0036C70F9F
MISPEGAHWADLFDSLGLEYERSFTGKRQAQIDAVAELMCRLAPGARVLDVGCASGRPTTEQLCAGGMDVTGMDVSPVMLEHARRQVPQARFVLADLFVFDDIEALDALGVHDAAVCLFCLVNLPGPRFVDGLRRLAALTRPGGTLLVAVPEIQGTEEVRFIERTYRPARCLSEDLHRYARQAGLEVERVETRTEPAPDGQAEPGTILFLWARNPES